MKLFVRKANFYLRIVTNADDLTFKLELPAPAEVIEAVREN